MEMMMQRVMFFVMFWTLVNVLLVFLLGDSHHCTARWMIKRIEGDCHLFNHTVDCSFNITDDIQSHISLVRLFYDTTSTAELFICATNVICDVNCVGTTAVTYCSVLACISSDDLLTICRIFRKIVQWFVE